MDSEISEFDAAFANLVGSLGLVEQRFGRIFIPQVTNPDRIRVAFARYLNVIFDDFFARSLLSEKEYELFKRLLEIRDTSKSDFLAGTCDLQEFSSASLASCSRHADVVLTPVCFCAQWCCGYAPRTTRKHDVDCQPTSTVCSSRTFRPVRLSPTCARSASCCRSAMNRSCTRLRSF